MQMILDFSFIDITIINSVIYAIKICDYCGGYLTMIFQPT